MESMQKLPVQSTLMSIVQRDIDERGSITSIVDTSIKNVSLITCKSGTIRSNHYHKNDFHFIYVIRGEIDYFFKNLTGEEMKYIKVREGESIFTPSKEWHATFFPINCELIVSSYLPRDQKTYEADTVREELINAANIDKFLKRFSN